MCARVELSPLELQRGKWANPKEDIATASFTKQPGLIDLLMAHDDFPVGHACAPSLHCACCVLVPW